MSKNISDSVRENILAAMVEGNRLKTLTNEELVSEYLKLGDADDELHTNEMCSRLWPGWEDSEL